MGLAMRLFPVMHQQQLPQAALSEITETVAHCLQACEQYLEFKRQFLRLGLWQPKSEVYLTLLAAPLQCATPQLYRAASALEPMAVVLCPIVRAFRLCTHHLQPQCREAEEKACRTLFATARQLLKETPHAATPAAVAEYGAASTAAAAWAAHCMLDSVCLIRYAWGNARQLWQVSDWHVLLLHRCARLLTDPALQRQLQAPAPKLHALAPYTTTAGCSSAAALLSMTLWHGIITDFTAMRGCLREFCDTDSERREMLLGRARQLHALAAVVALPGRMSAGDIVLVARELHASAWQYNIAGFLADALALLHDPQRSLADTKKRAAVPAAVAASVALLSFGEVAGRRGSRPSDVESTVPGSMQLVACAARHLHSLARLLQSGEAASAAVACAALSSQGAAAMLRNTMAWLAEAATPVATASAVLAEGLPALAAIAGADEATWLALAEAGGQHEWAPVAAALQLRLPRRMAARFVPDVERVTAAVADRGTAAQARDALVVMAAMQLQVRCESKSRPAAALASIVIAGPHNAGNFRCCCRISASLMAGVIS